MYRNWYNCLRKEINLGNVRVNLLIISTLLYLVNFAKAPQVSLTIPKDSVYVGEPFEAILTVTHDVQDDLLFVDSAYDFGEFEFVNKAWKPTTVTDSVLIDYAIYSPRTFELDSTQTLFIPVFKVTSTDTFALASNTDTFQLRYELDTLPQTIELKENTAFVKPQLPVGKIIAGVSTFVGVIILAICWFVFGKKLIAQIRAFFIRKRYKKFEEEFKSTLDLVKENPRKANELVKVWKRYNQVITGRRFKAMTTKELGMIFENDDLEIALNNLDKTIYGNKPLNNIDGHYLTLKQFAQQQSEQKIQELINDAKRSKRVKHAA